jgi:hypothetical protein
MRLRIYREAYATGEHSLCSRVGTAFAKLCDRVGDVDTIWFGGSSFSLTLKDTFRRLRRLEGQPMRLVW